MSHQSLKEVELKPQIKSSKPQIKSSLSKQFGDFLNVPSIARVATGDFGFLISIETDASTA